MPSIGIVANPASGKDIRRLVSYATVIDNYEKVNIVKRVVLAAQALGIDAVHAMPDSFQTARQAADDLRSQGVLMIDIELVEIPVTASALDSTAAAARMEELGVGCIVVLGGDGTSRAVAKAVATTPILPLSTGTNNVYPRLLEGTVAGLAAGCAARLDDPFAHCIHDKRIEIWVNGEFRDIALVDAMICSDTYPGARAIWNLDHVRHVVVSRCHPASIGFSTLAGGFGIVTPSDDGGFSVELGPGERRVRAAVAAGVISEVEIADARRLDEGEWWELDITERNMLALDGEREVKLRPGDHLACRVLRNGPWRVLPEPIIAAARECGIY